MLEFGELTIDISGHKILVSGEEVDLTASEFKLLTTLCRYPGRVYSRMELVEKVLGYDFEGYERTIDSHVKNLRAKIGDNPRNPKWLDVYKRQAKYGRALDLAPGVYKAFGANSYTDWGTRNVYYRFI